MSRELFQPVSQGGEAVHGQFNSFHQFNVMELKKSPPTPSADFF
jgi:hypothetical protein